MRNGAGDKAGNLKRMLDYIQRGIEARCDLLCFSELALNG